MHTAPYPPRAAKYSRCPAGIIERATWMKQVQTEITGARKMERLKGKNVLITGASSGIGQAIAVRFAREGANIAINYRSGAEQAEATQTMAKAARSNGGGRELLVQADVSNE